MRCETCRNGERRPARRPQVAQKNERVAVVTDVPVQECPSCGEIWLEESVALKLDALLTQMLSDEVVAIRPYPEATAAAA